MAFSLVFQSTYRHLEVGLFHDGSYIDFRRCDKKESSAQCIPMVDDVLKKNKIESTQIEFIGANQGPAPFTTLRVALSSANGLGYSLGIPLVGVDGIDVAMHEHAQAQYEFNVFLLNAFGGQAYFGISHSGGLTKGCKKIQDVLQDIETSVRPKDSIFFFGAGLVEFRDEIVRVFGDRAIIPSEFPHTSTLGAVGVASYNLWDHQKGARSNQLMPLYGIHSASEV